MGVHRPQGQVSVIVENYSVNRGFTMPHLEGWFHSSTTISSASVVVPSGPLLLYGSRFIIFYSKSEGYVLPINATNCELVIFRKSAVGHYLVNL